jgi:hypothetical protein
MIGRIRAKIAPNRFEFSEHAVDQSIIRHVAVEEIRQAILGGEIIEDYPDDKYGPSCLILGFIKRADHCTSNVVIPLARY